MYGQEQTLGPEIMAKREAAMAHELRHGAIAGATLGGDRVRQQAPMEGLLQQLIHCLGNLEDTVATLDGRLQPIRNQAPQVEKNMATGAIPSGSVIGSTIAHQTVRLQNLNQRLLSIMAELEI